MCKFNQGNVEMILCAGCFLKCLFIQCYANCSLGFFVCWVLLFCFVVVIVVVSWFESSALQFLVGKSGMESRCKLATMSSHLSLCP